MKKQLLGWIAFTAIFFFSAACTDNEKTAKLQVWMTDAPGDYEEVNVDVQGLEIHSSESDNGTGWKSLEVNKGVYDLRKLTNGLDTLLGELEIPAGRISQIRLILGNDNTIKVGGQYYDIATPSGQQSGLKLQVHEVLTEGITYKILLDFDVARSIVQRGNGAYLLKPVIRTITEAQDGAIKGVIEPAESTPAIYAIIGEDTLGTTYSNEAGEFLIRGLAAGSYTVSFDPNSNYQSSQKTNIPVQIGTVTNLGIVTIEQ